MTHKVVFNSSAGAALISLACGYVSLTEIAFENEKIVVSIEAKTGEVTFYDLQGNHLLSATVDVPPAGDEKYSEVSCSVDESRIRLGFPTYSYEDNYPNCDGEYDRWTKVISGYRYLCYDPAGNCIIG